jgi:hypothetical protein
MDESKRRPAFPAAEKSDLTAHRMLAVNVLPAFPLVIQNLFISLPQASGEYSDVRIRRFSGICQARWRR